MQGLEGGDDAGYDWLHEMDAQTPERRRGTEAANVGAERLCEDAVVESIRALMVEVISQDRQVVHGLPIRGHRPENSNFAHLALPCRIRGGRIRDLGR